MPGVYLKEVAQLVTKLKIESSPSNATEAPLWISNSDFIQCQTLAEISMEHPWGVYPIPHMALEATKMGGCQNCLKIWRRPCEVKVQLRDSAKSLLTATWRESGGIGKRPHQSRSQLSASAQASGQAGSLCSRLANSWLECSHRPKIAFRVSHVELGAPFWKCRRARHMQGPDDVRPSCADALVVFTDGPCIFPDQGNRGHANLRPRIIFRWPA